MRSRRRNLAAVLATAGLALALVAPSAGALTPYQRTETILPPFHVPTGLAVDQSNGDLYIGTRFTSGFFHFDATTEVTKVLGEGQYESVAVNPVNRNVYALTKPPFPIRVESYDLEGEIAQKPIPTPAGRGIIGADSQGNVFIVDVGAINEQQKFTVAATGGTYTLIFDGQETGPLAWNAGDFEVGEALAALPKIGAENVSVSQSGQTYTVSFQNGLANTNLPLIGADSTNLTEGSVTRIETVVDGSAAPPSIKEFAPNGTLKQAIDCAACPGGPFTTIPTGVALDNADNLYVGDAAGERVIMFHATPGNPTNYSAIAPTEFDVGPVRSFAVNPVTGQLFVGGDDGAGFHIKGYEPDGTLFADFAHGIFSGNFASFGTEQLAVDANDGTVWIGDLFEGPNGFIAQIIGFVPAPPPTIETTPATVIETSTSATLNGTVNPNGTLVLSCKFEYGLDSGYGTTVPCNDPGFGTEPVPVSAEVKGLQPDTGYHYRIVATNETGTTTSGDQEFKTLIPKAGVSTGDATAAQTVATLVGTVNPGGNQVDECRFEYGSDASYGKVVPCASLPGSGSGAVAVSGVIAGLGPNSTYHYRLVAVNAGGTQFGLDRTVTTLPKAPAVETGGASKVSADAARVSGTVIAEGSVARYRFEYGTTAAYGKSTADSAIAAADTVKATADLAGLEPATTYHYRLTATSAGGTTVGADQTFTTGPRPIGRVFLPAKAPLKAGKAAIELQCRGVAIAECKGSLVLRARIKQGIRFILVKVGEADFQFFGGQKRVITIALNKAGKKVIRQSEGKPIPAVASAANKNRVVRLFGQGGVNKRRGG